MDISKVEEKLRNNEYKKTYDFAIDVRKIWNNSFRYNIKGSEIYFMTTEMSIYFEKQFKNVKN